MNGWIIIPIVAKTIGEAEDQMRQIQADAVEIRLDALEQNDPAGLTRLVAKAQVLMTDRRKAEGGFKAQTDAQRFETLKEAVQCRPWAVDLEIESPRMFRRKLITLARENGVKIISSYHNLKRTPRAEKLEKTVNKALEQADYAKVACMPNGPKDTEALLNLVRQHPGRVAAFGLGEKAAYSRIQSLKLGAPFGYARGVTATASGQLGVAQMRRMLKQP